MRIETSKLVLAIICVLPVLAGCSSKLGDSRTTSEGPGREFGEAEKVAARVLSISNNQASIKAESPYAQAVLCKDGMELIAQRFRDAGGLSDRQRQAIDQATAYFDERLQRLAAAEGKTASDISKDLQRVSEETEAGDRGRIAIDCLRRLQETG